MRNSVTSAGVLLWIEINHLLNIISKQTIKRKAINSSRQHNYCSHSVKKATKVATKLSRNSWMYLLISYKYTSDNTGL